VVLKELQSLILSPQTTQDRLSVSVKNFTYKLGKVFFENICLNLNPGEWTALIGRSGIGKSTLLRIISGLEVSKNMQLDINFGNQRLPAGSVSYLAQHDTLLPWLNVQSNITFSTRLRGEYSHPTFITDILAETGLINFREHYPHQLSGGLRQRTNLARILYEKRPIVLMDEPFSSLDMISRYEIQDLARKFLKNHIVLLVTHDLVEAARLCDRTYIIYGEPIKIDEVKMQTNNYSKPISFGNPIINQQAKIMFDLILKT
jgi:putative hydroxymethylpyrimidine transport system ATP-binding protein